MYRYAQIDENGNLQGISNLLEPNMEQICNHLIPISEEENLDRKKWDKNLGQWVEKEETPELPAEKPEKSQLSDFEVAQLDVLATIYEELLDIKENISSTV